jgi:hypothetical protein
MSISFLRGKPRCILTIVLLVFVLAIIAMVWLLSSAMFFGLLTWPVWLSKPLDFILYYSEKSIIFKIIFIISFIFLAFLLFNLKKKAIIIYGVIECIGGIFSIWYSFSQSFSDNVIHALTIGGGVFLFINGIENYLKGYKENNKAKENQP